MKKLKNYGLDLEIERTSQDIKDWQFGSRSSDCKFDVPPPYREQFLPVGESQKGKEDFQDCVSRGFINVLEMKFTYAYRKRMMSEENRIWLKENNYLTIKRDGSFCIEFSDRFVAINSETTRTGNGLKKVAEAIRKQGLIPKRFLPKTDGMTWDEYHNKNEIDSHMKKLGKEFVKRFNINYEQVLHSNFHDAIKLDALVVAGYAWPNVNSKGEYVKSANNPNHVFMIYEPYWLAFDNYIENDNTPWIKKLVPEYNFYRQGYRIYVSMEKVGDAGLLDKIISCLKNLI